MTRKRLVCFVVFALVLAVGIYADGSLFILAATGTAEEVQSVIRKRANVNARRQDGATPLMLAALSNPNPKVLAVLIDAGANVNARGEDGITPLMVAAESSTPGVIELLIDAGADVNPRSTFYRATPLMWAAGFNPNPEVIALLLDAGADGRAKDREGKTAFDYAKENEALVGTDVYWRLHDAQY